MLRFQFFAFPVDLEKYPNYKDVVDHPMDLSTIKIKMDAGRYTSYEALLQVGRWLFGLLLKCFLGVSLGGFLGGWWQGDGHRVEELSGHCATLLLRSPWKARRQRLGCSSGQAGAGGAWTLCTLLGAFTVLDLERWRSAVLG